MRQNRAVGGTGAVLAYLLAAALWVGLTRVAPEGAPRAVSVLGVGLLFLCSYAWLLVSSLRAIMIGARHTGLRASLILLVVIVMLAAFGAVYQQLGLIDDTGAGGPMVHDFWIALYYSVVTFTTLGYGDFYPHGIGRALAGMQALTGYIILGLLASVAASVISPHNPAGRRDGEAEGDEGGDGYGYRDRDGGRDRTPR